jgi:hypothetical protein
MKRFHLIIGLGAMLALAAPLAACTADQASSAAVSVTSTSNSQQHALAAAENAYSIVGQAVLTWADVKKPSDATKAEIKRLDNLVYAVLVKARDANARGDSPAVAAAVEALKGSLAKYMAYLTGLGVPVPALPAL